MKKRLNVLCVLVFVIIGIGLMPFVYWMAVGMKAGYESSPERVRDIDAAMNAETVHLMPVGISHLEHGTIRNDVTGEQVALWPQNIAVSAGVDYPGWYDVVNTLATVLGVVAVIVVVVLFLKLILRVNRGYVFEWRNVRLLRWLGGIQLAASIVVTLLQIYGASVVSGQFRVSGYVTDYFSYVSVLELSIGMVALIAAEIFAIGLKMKEEQELTI